MSTVGDFCGSVALTVPSLCHQRAPRHPWMHLTRTHGGGRPLTMSRFPSVVMTSHLTLVHILSDDDTRQGISYTQLLTATTAFTQAVAMLDAYRAINIDMGL